MRKPRKKRDEASATDVTIKRDGHELRNVSESNKPMMQVRMRVLGRTGWVGYAWLVDDGLETLAETYVNSAHEALVFKSQSILPSKLSGRVVEMFRMGAEQVAISVSEWDAIKASEATT